MNVFILSPYDRSVQQETLLLFSGSPYIHQFQQYLITRQSSITYAHQFSTILRHILTNADNSLRTTINNKAAFTGPRVNYLCPTCSELTPLKQLSTEAVTFVLSGHSYTEKKYQLFFLKQWLTPYLDAKHIKIFCKKQIHQTKHHEKVSKDTRYMKLPFCGLTNFNSRKQITEVLEQYYLKIISRIILTKPHKHKQGHSAQRYCHQCICYNHNVKYIGSIREP